MQYRKFLLQHTDSYPTQHQWVITQSFAASDCLIILHTFHISLDSYRTQVRMQECKRILQQEFPVLYNKVILGELVVARPPLNIKCYGKLTIKYYLKKYLPWEHF